MGTYNLPSWAECNAKYGSLPEEMTPLEKFINEYEPVDGELFRKMLSEVLVSMQPKITFGHPVPFKDEMEKAID